MAYSDAAIVWCECNTVDRDGWHMSANEDLIDAINSVSDFTLIK